MEQEQSKKVHGSTKYFTEKYRKLAITKSKTKYMLNKPWFCDVCNHDYTLAGKWCHLKTKKHQKNTSNIINK